MCWAQWSRRNWYYFENGFPWYPHFLLNLSCTMVGLLLFLNNLFQLLWDLLAWWSHTPVLLKFVTMLNISLTSICIQ
jgi:hypothetical protein